MKTVTWVHISVYNHRPAQDTLQGSPLLPVVLAASAETIYGLYLETAFGPKSTFFFISLVMVNPFFKAQTSL